MKIEFVFPGKTKDKGIEEGYNVYLKRINRYISAEIKVIPVTSGFSPDAQKKKEAELILGKITDKDLVIILDDKGRQFTSEEFSGQLNKFISSGKAKIIFVMVGAFGLDDMLRKRADMLISFSKMTFTHQMIRLVVLEQVYRAFTIMKNEKYHH